MNNDKTTGLNSTQFPINETFKSLMEIMTNNNGCIDPEELLKSVALYEELFEDRNQHDAHEFLIALLNLLDFEFNESGHQSIIEKVFGGLFCNSVL